jgi:hypothetical protein
MLLLVPAVRLDLGRRFGFETRLVFGFSVLDYRVFCDVDQHGPY